MLAVSGFQMVKWFSASFFRSEDARLHWGPFLFLFIASQFHPETPLIHSGETDTDAMHNAFQASMGQNLGRELEVKPHSFVMTVVYSAVTAL